MGGLYGVFVSGRVDKHFFECWHDFGGSWDLHNQFYHGRQLSCSIIIGIASALSVGISTFGHLGARAHKKPTGIFLDLSNLSGIPILIEDLTLAKFGATDVLF